MFKEFDIGRRLDHPGIVKTMYFLKMSQFSKKLSGYNNEFHIFLEYMEGGSLQSFLSTMPNKKIQNMAQCKDFMKQIVKAVVYAHSLNIVH